MLCQRLDSTAFQKAEFPLTFTVAAYIYLYKACRTKYTSIHQGKYFQYREVSKILVVTQVHHDSKLQRKIIKNLVLWNSIKNNFILSGTRPICPTCVFCRCPGHCSTCPFLCAFKLCHSPCLECPLYLLPLIKMLSVQSLLKSHPSHGGFYSPSPANQYFDSPHPPTPTALATILVSFGLRIHCFLIVLCVFVFSPLITIICSCKSLQIILLHPFLHLILSREWQTTEGFSILTLETRALEFQDMYLVYFILSFLICKVGTYNAFLTVL